jgi:ketosteroid isomerase-like protein
MGAQARATIRLIVAIGIFAPLVACNSLLGELDRIKKKYDEKNGPKPCTENCAAAPASYTIGGTVTGLAGTGLVLQNNGGNNLNITANGSFTFSTPIADGASYNVTVLTQPSSPNQICSVTNATGTVTGANVTSVAVNCITNTYTIGGTVTGLAGTGLVLQNNGGNNLTIATNGSFTFSTAIADGASYNVTVLTQPSSPNQICSVTNATGTVTGANVTNVAVNCTTNNYTIGGSVTGLAGTGLVLQNNGADDLSLASNGSFTFSLPLTDGEAYNVTVKNNPTGQFCRIDYGAGAVAGGNVTNVAVTCSASDFTWIQDAYLKASNAEANDRFGDAVAISGSTIVVGARFEDSNQTTITNTDGLASSDNSASASGAVYVFKRDANGDWIQDAYLKASNAEGSDQFGYSVAISGSTIVVGAGGEASNQTTITNTDGLASSNNSAYSSGAVYVFKRDANGDWIQDAYLKASNAQANDYFGRSVAISGSTIVVGAYGEDSNQTTITNNDGQPGLPDNNTAGNSGAVYVFKRDANGDWIQDAYLKASNAGANDWFGYSVAVSGSTIAVAAYGEASNQTTITNADGSASANDSASAAGAVYVFKRDANGDWIQDAYLKASNAWSGDYFGSSVAISGSTIVVGAWGEDSSQTTITNTDGCPGTAPGCSADNNSATDSGAVFVFKRDGNGDWIQDAYLKASNAGDNDWFGSSVAISGSTIVVGAYREDSNQTTITNTDGLASAVNGLPDSGAVYVFKRDAAGDWIQDAYLKASNADVSADWFGSSVAITGSTIVVGAYGEDSNQTTITNTDGSASPDNSATDSGAVYVFRLTP